MFCMQWLIILPDFTDPAMHGEISAITHCTEVLTAKGWTSQEILAGWKDFSLYTNGEP